MFINWEIYRANESQIDVLCQMFWLSTMTLTISIEASTHRTTHTNRCVAAASGNDLCRGLSITFPRVFSHGPLITSERIRPVIIRLSREIQGDTRKINRFLESLAVLCSPSNKTAIVNKKIDSLTPFFIHKMHERSKPATPQALRQL